MPQNRLDLYIQIVTFLYFSSKYLIEKIIAHNIEEFMEQFNLQSYIPNI
jgi:hypothetical protein